jgi:hypothetical protein
MLLFEVGISQHPALLREDRAVAFGRVKGTAAEITLHQCLLAIGGQDAKKTPTSSPKRR